MAWQLPVQPTSPTCRRPCSHIVLIFTMPRSLSTGGSPCRTTSCLYSFNENKHHVEVHSTKPISSSSAGFEKVSHALTFRRTFALLRWSVAEGTASPLVSTQLKRWCERFQLALFEFRSLHKLPQPYNRTNSVGATRVLTRMVCLDLYACFRQLTSTSLQWWKANSQFRIFGALVRSSIPRLKQPTPLS